MKLYLAPIHGTTLSPYRNIYSEIFGGFDLYCAPFIATTSMRKASSPIFKDILKEFNNENVDLIPQLIGNNGSDFSYFASVISSKGYDEINWNIGCPFPRVANKKKGSGILPYPDMIRRFLDEVCLDDSYGLSVKLRLGMYDLSEGIEVIDILNEYPLKGITIHGRVGTQKYEGVVDYDGFDHLRASSCHEVTYNGDIFTHTDFINVQNKFPTIDKFMIGRGALKNPFLASSIKGDFTPDDIKVKKMKEFHDQIYKKTKITTSSDFYLCSRMKEFWASAYTHLESNDDFIRNIEKTITSTDYTRLVENMFEKANWIE